MKMTFFLCNYIALDSKSNSDVDRTLSDGGDRGKSENFCNSMIQRFEFYEDELPISINFSLYVVMENDHYIQCVAS